MAKLKKLTLEISLKPFFDLSDQGVEAVFRTAFDQWRALCADADEVAVLYWAADGSEILDYRGDPDAPFAWCRYMGGANPRHWDAQNDPEKKGLHSRSYLYRENPPDVTYGDFARINRIAKRVGREMTGKPVTLTATFDPGPEFARSPFKYERHPEILRGLAMGKNSFVCCYAELHGDQTPYAAYPDGIPEGTPFGTFFGKQCKRFLADLGFDTLWLSNGFGFGTESWGVTGAIFDGARFDLAKIPETEQRILQFWKLFRAECPDLPIETRGTNLTVGIDFATDAVNYQKLYAAGLGLLPPPNSPWAALDGDFGLEIVGYLSRIATLPDQEYLFRYYVHDPWWVNSPWLDRYEGQPHDIYLPLAAARMDGTGAVRTPTHLSILSIDNTYGRMPDCVPQQCVPHLRRGLAELPDAVAPLLWVYPFSEYQDGGDPSYSATKPFFEDWYMRSAVGAGLPLNTVCSTESFAAVLAGRPDALTGRIVVSPYPLPGSAWERALLLFAEQGGQALLYGRAQPGELAEALQLTFAAPLDGPLSLDFAFADDTLRSGAYSRTLHHDPVLSDGGVDTDSAACPLATVSDGRCSRVYAAKAPHGAGTLLWVRGTNSASFQPGSHLLAPHTPSKLYPTGKLLRLALADFGLHLRCDAAGPDVRPPVALLHRCAGALFASVYNPVTTTALLLRTPLGAPLLMGYETSLRDGCSVYALPRAERREIRAFVAQPDGGLLSFREYPAISAQIDRRWILEGLQNADVYFLPQGDPADTNVLLNSQYPHVQGEPLDCAVEQTLYGPALHCRHVTGTLLFGRRYQGFVEP